MKRRILFWVGMFFLLVLPEVVAAKSPGFYVGAASCDITPDRPATLAGQFATRISQGVATPVTANVVAMEWVDAEGKSDYVIWVSLDVAVISPDFSIPMRKAFQEKFPQLEPKKLILSATHAHSTPSLTSRDNYLVRDKGIMALKQYVPYVTERTLLAIEKAWESRTAGKYAYGMDFAVVAYNRRAIYADGRAVMYGNTNDPNFRAMEGMEDHDIGCMFFWNAENKLIAAIVNVACPAQENEGSMKIDSDFWHPVRTTLQKKHGEDLVVLGLCGAAGDMSPHIRYRHAAEERMRELRKLSRTEELARRIVAAVENVWEVVEERREVPSVMRHLYEEMELPERKITEADYRRAVSEAERLEKVAAESQDGGASNGSYSMAKWHRRIAERWEKLSTNPNPTYSTCVHVVRIGDTVWCTNSFELYTDFGVQMKARSPAKQTFVVQLCDGLAGGGTYLPSERAMRGGGYGAIIQSNMVGAEGGQILVEKTLELANQLFPKK
ncbi:MAG: hypothetical protein Q4D62_06220 [Planctomycetia bacterium]|nr:hypothetical protein [Planctomycetia bacterium]